MNPDIILPPQVAWASGVFANGPLIRKTTRVADLHAVFSDNDAWLGSDPQQSVYDVEMFDSPSGEGALYVGVTHLHAGKIGNEFFMTRGHFHQRREQGEVYFGLRGCGLLLLQTESGDARLERVTPGSVHIIPPFTAHRLINTADETLSALAVWPSVAGHDYAALAGVLRFGYLPLKKIRRDGRLTMANYGLDMTITHRPLGFSYGDDVTGPMPEIRTLDQIRPSLRNPECEGPEQVYAIAMDVARLADRQELEKRMLLFGVVTYAAGTLGEEPVRSQGHIHRISQHSGWSPPELYEIWQGKAIIYMQEYVEDDPGRCFAVLAGPGEKVLVPPGWGHATISASPDEPLTFGAWCDREYGFEYDAVRARKGLAWYPLIQGNNIIWQHNHHYMPGRLQMITPRCYREFGLTDAPIYQQLIDDPARFQFISRPDKTPELWDNFHP